MAWLAFCDAHCDTPANAESRGGRKTDQRINQVLDRIEETCSRFREAMAADIRSEAPLAVFLDRYPLRLMVREDGARRLDLLSASVVAALTALHAKESARKNPSTDMDPAILEQAARQAFLRALPHPGSGRELTLLDLCQDAPDLQRLLQVNGGDLTTPGILGDAVMQFMVDSTRIPILGVRNRLDGLSIQKDIRPWSLFRHGLAGHLVRLDPLGGPPASADPQEGLPAVLDARWDIYPCVSKSLH